MALPNPGVPLSLSQIQGQFGGGATDIRMNEYYAGGAYVPAGTTGYYGAIPSSGAIGIKNFYGAPTSYVYSFSITVGGQTTSGGGQVTVENGYRTDGATYGSISGSYATVNGTITSCYSFTTTGPMINTDGFVVYGLSSVVNGSTIYLGGSINQTFTWPSNITGSGFYRWTSADPFAGVLAGTVIPCTLTLLP